MTITINLPPEEEARLRKRAARQGKDPADGGPSKAAP